MSGLTIPWLGYGLMALAAMLLLIPGWPYVTKIRIQSPVRISKGSAKIVAIRQDGTVISEAIPPLTVPNGDCGWWAALADGDRKDIKHRVPLRHAYAGMESVIKTGYCCIHFVFVFINATVYRIDVDPAIAGEVYADGKKLPDNLVMDMGTEELSFPHAIGFGLRCRLQVTEPYRNELTKMEGKSIVLLMTGGIRASLVDPAGSVVDKFTLETPGRIVLDIPNDFATMDHARAPRMVDLSR